MNSCKYWISVIYSLALALTTGIHAASIIGGVKKAVVNGEIRRSQDRITLTVAIF